MRTVSGAVLMAVCLASCMKPPPTTVPTMSTETRGDAAGWLDGGTWASQHSDILKLELEKRPRVTLLGDSLTQGWGGPGRKVSAPGKAAFDEKLAPLGAANFGIAGDGTAQILWRIQNGTLSTKTSQVVVLNAGTNNIPSSSVSDVVAGVKAVLQEIQRQVPTARVLLVGILPRGEAKDPIRRKVYEANRGLTSLTDGHAVAYLDCTREFVLDGGDLKPGLFEPDQLHLTPEGYRAWAESLAPAIEQMLKLGPLTPASESAGPMP